MEIRLGSLLAGAREAEGTVVIIDVYRAFTTEAVAFQRGVEKIVLVAEIEEALALRDQGIGDLCVGEVDGKRPEGFDFCNSPYELSEADLAGKTLIHSTRAGTVGVTSATKADLIYGGSLVVARATAQAILKRSPEVVTLVAMGWAGKERTDEDEQCGLYLRNLLHGLQPDREAVRSLVAGCKESQKFGDPEQPHFYAEDRELALEVDTVPFAIRIEREGKFWVSRPEKV
ncbi:MAG: 2-phosphosulfolactate phosphatase [bacterium]|nr:2-phosphosulfolactate phosphatase [bacterium]